MSYLVPHDLNNQNKKTHTTNRIEMFVKVALFLLLSVEIESCGSPHYSPPHFKRNGQQEGQSGEVDMDRMMGRMGPE